MSVISREYSDDSDHARVMGFLREAYAETRSLEGVAALEARYGR